MTERYCINPAYVHREEYVYFDDTPLKDEWQNEVYELALNQHKPKYDEAILDVGCGSGFKLLKYFKDHLTIGIDVKDTVIWLKKTYPDRNWMTFNYNIKFPCDFSTVICSDVIEHVEEPDNLLKFIASINFKYLFISTPDRARLPEEQQLGPPVNKHHLREWTGPEFYRFVSQYFHVRQQKHLEQHGGQQQLLICTPK